MKLDNAVCVSTSDEVARGLCLVLIKLVFCNDVSHTNVVLALSADKQDACNTASRSR